MIPMKLHTYLIIHIMISPTTKAHSLVILWGKFKYWTQCVCKNRICTLTVRSRSGDVAASRQPAGQWHLSRTFDATSAANFMMETQLIYQISWCTDILSLKVYPTNYIKNICGPYLLLKVVVHPMYVRPSVVIQISFIEKYTEHYEK